MKNDASTDRQCTRSPLAVARQVVLSDTCSLGVWRVSRHKWSPAVRCNEGRFSYFYVKFGCCIESYVVTVYAVNDTGKIYNALRKFGTLEFVRCTGENIVNGVRSNEVRLPHKIHYGSFFNARKNGKV